MLWKYFQNCMYSFRKNSEINLRICQNFHSCIQFPWNRQYFSSVVLRLRGRLFIAPWHGFHLFDNERYIGLIPRRRASPWLAHFSSISAAICLLLKIFCQDNKFCILKSFLHFLHPACPAASRNFCYCNAI